MELEEEKKAQAEWEKRVQEQAKKIESLSSMVLYSTRDENRDHNKKVCTMINICILCLYYGNRRNSTYFKSFCFAYVCYKPFCFPYKHHFVLCFSYSV